MKHFAFCACNECSPKIQVKELQCFLLLLLLFMIPIYSKAVVPRKNKRFLGKETRILFDHTLLSFPLLPSEGHQFVTFGDHKIRPSPAFLIKIWTSTI
jgi:hypothetical protein